MILILDNYDSFTYNLYQFIGEMCRDVTVYRNDAITIEEIERLDPSAIVISPGPGYPAQAGITIPLVKHFAGKTPILGVCLGFQGIVEAMGGLIIHAKELMHGKVSDINIETGDPLFAEMPGNITAARYHSLAAEDSLPKTLKITARAKDGEIMAVSNPEMKLYGVQFHPESVMTKYGKRILRNFLSLTNEPITADTLEKYTKEPDTEVLKPFIQKVIIGASLSEDEARTAMDGIMNGNATNAQIGSFLTAMRMKGETIDEITGFAKSMRGKAAPMAALKDTIDIVGTGGDLAHTFNISTTTAFVVAAAGARVTKHGNRSVSSLSGSADVLEALGVNINMSSAQAVTCLEATGLCFMFAPVFHKSMRFAASPRKEIGVRSVFNILGPLANPAKAEYMLLGVYDINLMETIAMVLKNLGVKKALVVHGADGLDEVTSAEKTHICEIEQSRIVKYSIHPSDFGLDISSPADLKGGDARDNAKILKGVLSGKKGPKRDITLLNAAASLYALGKCFNINHGVKIAAETIDNGLALKKLEQLVEYTNGIAI